MFLSPLGERPSEGVRAQRGGPMYRRTLLASVGGWAATRSLVAGAQQPRLLGLLVTDPIKAVFVQQMTALGYVEGKTVRYETRPPIPADRLPAFAAELVALKVDLIIAGGTEAVRAAQQATKTIPIVMSGSSDPERTGLVKSLARPGGNTTGLSL